MNLAPDRFQLAFDLVNYTNMHLFLTGRAGTGKTTFLHYLKKHTHKAFAVVAPTGVAAINAGGVTLHSFLGIPINCVYVPDHATGQYRIQEASFAIHDRYSLLQSLRLQGMRKKVLQQLELLIIDEVSMVRADTLDMVNAILQHVRRNKAPFGGVQVLFIGDLFQLPPVINREQEMMVSQWYRSGHFFEARVMLEAKPQFLELNKVFRQRDDRFVDLLNKVRNNLLMPADMELLHERYDPDFEPPQHQGFITLTTHNYLADQINNSTLEALETDASTCRAELNGDFPEKSYPAEQKLVLKPGAQVMFIKNDTAPTKRYYNGKIGEVVDIERDEVVVRCPGEEEEIRVPRVEWNHIRYRWDETNKDMQEEVLGSFRQFPLRLAWAVTIHKSQGLTFDHLVIDAGQAFQEGQVYVALSRATTLEGIYLRTAIPQSRIKTNERVVQFYSKERPIAALSSAVQQEKAAYVQRQLLETCSWHQVMVKLVQVKSSLLSINRFTAEPFHTWINQLQECLQASTQAAKPWQEPLAQHIRQMEQEVHLLAMNQLLQAQIPDWLATMMGPLEKCLRTTPRIPLDAEAADTEALEQLSQLLEETTQMLQAQLQRLTRLKNGYDESIFFKKHEYTGPDEKSHAATEAKKIATDAPKLNYPMPLLDALRLVVRQIAAQEKVPAYIISHTAALEMIAATLPETPEDLIRIRGFSPRKVDKYGAEILQVVANWRKQHPETNPTAALPPVTAARTPKAPKETGNTVLATLELYRQGLHPAAIAANRGLALSTIEGHLAQAISKKLITGDGLVPAAILDACRSLSQEAMQQATPETIKAHAGADLNWGMLRIARAILAREQPPAA